MVLNYVRFEFPKLICKLQSKPFLWCGDLNLNQCQFDLSFLNLKTPIEAVFVLWRLESKIFCALKSLNARWSTIWSWILSLYHLINRLNKQDFTLSSLNLHWAFTLDKKNGGEIKLTLQLKITTPESDKRKLVFKAFYVTSIGSIQISSKFAVIVIAWFSVLFLPSDCKVSKTSYLIRLIPSFWSLKC